MASDTEGEGFVVAAFENFDFAGGEEVKILEKIEEAFVAFVDTKNCGGIAGVEFGEENAALLAKLREAAAEGNTVGAGFVRGETFDEESFDGRRDGVLEAFGFGVRLGPGNADDFGEQHFGELMAKHKMLGGFEALGGEMNLAATLHFDVTVAGHAFESRSDSGRSDVELLG